MHDSPADAARYRWIILITAVCGFSAYAFVNQSVPPVITLIIRDLSISHAQAGSLMGAFAFPGIFISLLAGMLSWHLGARRLGVLAFVCLAGGSLVTTLSHGYALLLASRLLAGAGGMTVAVIIPQLLAQWFHGRELGVAMAVFQASFTASAIVAFNVFARVGAAYTWSTVFAVSTLIAVFGGAVYALLARPAPTAPGAVNPDASLWKSWQTVLRNLWPLAFAWMCLNAAMISILTFTPDLLIGRGWSPVVAGRITSMVLWPTLVVLPIFGWLVDRTQLKLPFAVAGGCFCCIAVLGIADGRLPIEAMLLLMGTGVGCIVPSTYAMPSDRVQSQALPLAFGLLIACQSLGVTIGPYLTGLVRDLTGGYYWSYLLIAVYLMLLLCGLAALRFRRGGHAGPPLTNLRNLRINSHSSGRSKRRPYEDA